MVPEQRPVPINEASQSLIQDYVEDYGQELILTARERAYEGRFTSVTPDIVIAANDEINRKRKTKSWSEIGLLIAGAMLGSGMQGFITELSTGRVLWIAVYVVVGFLGLILGFLCLWR